MSPVKVTLTPAKDGEGTDEVVTLVRAADEAAQRRGGAGKAAAVGEGASGLYPRGRGGSGVRQVPSPRLPSSIPFLPTSPWLPLSPSSYFSFPSFSPSPVLVLHCIALLR